MNSSPQIVRLVFEANDKLFVLSVSNEALDGFLVFIKFKPA
jgi:hypothetical protein